MKSDWEGKSIIFIDGKCIVCNRWLKAVLKNEGLKDFYISSIHQPIFKDILESKIGRIETVPDSIVVFEKDTLYYRWEALNNIYKHGNPILHFLTKALMKLPFGIGVKLYDFIARRRHSLFGKKEKDSCDIPSPELKARILI